MQNCIQKVCLRNGFQRTIAIMTLSLLSGLIAQKGAQAYTFDSDIPQNIQTQMSEDLGFVKGIQSKTQSDLHKSVFGAVSGEVYDHFFSERVTSIGLSTCGDPNAVACVIPFFDSSKMWITKNYIRFSHPQIARLMVVFHEARHTEDRNDNWPHANCPVPFEDKNGAPRKSIWTGAPLAGKPACDVTPFGSYGSSLIMLKNVSKFCTTCTEKIKMDAGLYAEDQLTRITDQKAHEDIVNDLFKS